MKRFAVVMAGGVGSRLWPLSTRKRPKQFIQIEKGRTIIEMSINRLGGIILQDNCYVITNIQQEDIMAKTLDGIIPHSNIICEPLRKNTCACITYSALLMKRKYGSGVICFVPSDSFISNAEKYKETLETAFNMAEKYSQLVVVGVRPSFPATDYGYIKADASAIDKMSKVKKVIEFTEKPNSEKAGEYISSGQYLWNSGMLVGNIDCILESVKKYMPELFRILSEAIDKIDSCNYVEVLSQAYGELESVSLDFAVLEKTKDLIVVEGEFDWSDIGSLQSLSKFFETYTPCGNAVKGEHVGIGTTDSIIYSDSGIIVTIGLDNVVIVKTGNVVLVCKKDKTTEIGNLIDELSRNGYEEYL